MAEEVGVQVVIGLMGPKGCGKDTIADLSIANMGASGKVATASYLKNLCSRVFKLDPKFFAEDKDKPFIKPLLLRGIQVRRILDEMDSVLSEDVKQQHGLRLRRIGVQKFSDRQFATPRQLLQFIGTEMIQSIFKPFHCVVSYDQIRGRPGVWFVTDLRFLHEEAYAKEVFPLFYPVKIVGRSEVADGAEEHVSESEWKHIKSFTTIENKGSLEDLAKQAAEAFKKIKADVKKRQPLLSAQDWQKMTCPPTVAALPASKAAALEVQGTSKSDKTQFYYQKQEDIPPIVPRDL